MVCQYETTVWYVIAAWKLTIPYCGIWAFRDNLSSSFFLHKWLEIMSFLLQLCNVKNITILHLNRNILHLCMYVCTCTSLLQLQSETPLQVFGWSWRASVTFPAQLSVKENITIQMSPALRIKHSFTFYSLSPRPPFLFMLLARGRWDRWKNKEDGGKKGS